MSAKKDYYDEIIDSIEEATEQAKHYQGIVNGHDDGEVDFCLNRDEAERLANSWVVDLDTISDVTNITVDTLWDMSILAHKSKRKMLMEAEENRYKGKMSIEIA